ncbi:MAG: hypothetical protein WA705_21215 [Candidatus Ozemobacteraceae bacterium]
MTSLRQFHSIITLVILIISAVAAVEATSFEPFLRSFEFDDKKTVRGPIKSGIKFAKRGSPNALVVMSDCYQFGLGVPKDPRIALDFVNRLIEMGDPRGHFLLGNMRILGNGVRKDLKAAYGEYGKSARGGCDRAIFNLAWIVHTGFPGMAASDVLALEILGLINNCGDDLELLRRIRSVRGELAPTGSHAEKHPVEGKSLLELLPLLE